MSNRVGFWDVSRFVAMLMVLYWHFLYYTPAFSRETASYAVNFIIGANMPIFFAISGYFARRMHMEARVDKLLTRLLKCLWPLVIVSIVMTGIDMCHEPLNLVAVSKCFLNYIVFYFWFINCLLMCHGITFLVFKFSRGNRMLLCGGLVGSFFLLWLCPFGLWGAKSMIPLYWLGVFGFPALFDGRLSKRTSTLIGLLCFVSFCVFVLCEGNVMVNGLGFYWCKMGLLEFSWKGFFLMMARYVTGALGAIGVITVIMALCRYRWIATSSVYGRETLGIYLIHFVFLFPFLKLVNVTNGFVRLGLVCVFFLFCHYAVVLSKRFSVVKTLLWGPEAFRV